MAAFIVFMLFGGMLLGGGAMLSPAWPTQNPRIGLAGTLALALVAGGAVFWAMTFGWDPLVVDYILFALVTSVFLGGGLSFGQARAEARGETLSDADQGWTGAEDLLLFAGAALLFVSVTLLYPGPPGPVAEQQGFMALAAKLGGSFDTLAPFYPDERFAHPPAFNAISAYFSRQMNQPVPLIQFGLTALMALLLTWLIYDFGSEVRDKRLGRGMAGALLIGTGLVSALLAGSFSAVMGVLFTMTLIVYALRYRLHAWPGDAIGAGLMLGAVLIAHTVLFFEVLLVYGILLALSIGRLSGRQWLVMGLGVPLIAAVATGPYWLSVGLEQIMESSRTLSATAPPLDLIAYHGLLIFPLAAVGLYAGLRVYEGVVREVMALAATWLLLIAALALLGVYPVSPISLTLPLALLGGPGLLWLWETAAPLLAARFPVMPGENVLSRRALPIAAALTVVLVAGLAAALTLRFPQADLDRDELAAMDWLRVYTARDAVVVVEGEMRRVQLFGEREAITGGHAGYLYIAPGMASPADDALPLVFESGAARVYDLQPDPAEESEAAAQTDGS